MQSTARHGVHVVKQALLASNGWCRLPSAFGRDLLTNADHTTPALARCSCTRRRGLAAQAAGSQQPLARSVRPIPLTLITVAKGSSKGAELMAAEWADKLRRYTSLTELQIKPNPKNAKETSVAVQHEGERVLRSIQPSDRVVLLDERGRDVSSEDLARLLAQASDQSWPSVVFCIGGPFGHSAAVRARGNDTIRLSKMVLNHQVAHVVLLEQLYRSWTILRGEPYHH